MNKIMRIILAVVTVLTLVILTGGAIWFVIKGTSVLLDIVCILLTITFGYFTWHDYNYFFGKK